MQLLTMLATADGRWIAADSAELLDWIGDGNPDFDPVGFVVRNLGFIQFDTYGDSFAQIALFPKRVAPAALGAVQERILTGVHRVFRIDHLDHETKRWQQALAMNPREAVGQLNRLCGTVIAPAAQAPYEAAARDLGTILSDENHPAYPLLRKWRSAFHQFDDTVLPFMDRHGLAARGMIIAVDLRRPDPIFRFIGDGYGLYDSFFIQGLGRKVAHQPDADYGQWVARFYAEVATSWQPRLDHCTAELKQASRPRIHYERLILPWSTESDEVFLTLSTRFLDADSASPSSDSTVLRKKAKSS
jgi:hypothetical protein